MPRSVGNIIADSLDLGLGYSERLLEGVSADKFARLAHTGRSPIRSNHAAFIMGHLSLYAPQILAPLVDGSSELQIPEGFASVFSKDATCQDDPDGKIYPPKDEVTDFFFRGYRRAGEKLREAPDALLDRENPATGRMKERFPTLGSLLAFYAGGHLMMHLGQLSAWRRMIGLGPA